MQHRVCFCYRWATYGGVERVFLNRALALRAHGVDVAIDVHYGADAGGLDAFARAIATLGLGSRLRIVPELDPAAYRTVCVIDSPEMLPADPGATATHWLVECHTPYPENRVYLDALPPQVDVVVPSATFAALLAQERPQLHGRIRVLRNCLGGEDALPPPRLPGWARIPLLYFGRLDELKNPQGLLDLLVALEARRPGRYMGVVLGPEVDGYGFDERLQASGLRGRVLRLPPLQFLRTQAFLRAWRDAGGLMVSPSRGESFGLAAAESIAAGVPVLLSGLPEHAELVGGDARHLYDAADPVSGAERIEALAAEYAAASERMLECARSLGSEGFVADWRALMAALGSPAALPVLPG